MSTTKLEYCTLAVNVEVMKYNSQLLPDLEIENYKEMHYNNKMSVNTKLLSSLELNKITGTSFASFTICDINVRNILNVHTNQICSTHFTKLMTIVKLS